MAKKAAKKKAVPSSLESVAVKNRAMSPNQIADAQKLLAQIGSGKKRGLIMVVEIKATLDGRETQGCSYINKISPVVVAETALSAFKLEPMAWLLAFQESLLKEGPQQLPPHKHDELGNCIL